MPMTIMLPNQKILSGKDMGKKAREYLHLDELDNDVEPRISVILSNSTWAVTASFFIGCFLDSVIHLGSIEKFEEKYRFFCDRFLEKSIEDGEHRCEVLLAYIRRCDQNVSRDELPRYFYV
jgi:hypothetical protein